MAIVAMPFMSGSVSPGASGSSSSSATAERSVNFRCDLRSETSALQLRRAIPSRPHSAV
jgi:hypothetical protein